MDKSSGKILGMLIGLIIAFFLVAWLTMALWNTLCPVLFNLPTITYWQTCGLQLLISCLFNFSNTKIGDKIND